MNRLVVAFVVAFLCAGCKSTGPVTVRSENGGRVLILKNETGQDLSGAKTRGHFIQAGQVFAVPPETIRSWPAGEEIRTINFRNPVSALVLHGFSAHGRFAAEWREAPRVLLDGRMVGTGVIDSVVDSTLVEVPIFGR